MCLHIQCHCVIYTVLLFLALKSQHRVDSCGFYFFLWTKHVLKPARFSPVWLLDGECNHQNFSPCTLFLLLFCFSLFLGWAWSTRFCCFLGRFVLHFQYLKCSEIWNWFCIFQLQWMQIWVYMRSMEFVIYMNWVGSWFLHAKYLICVPSLTVVQISCRNIRFLVP